MSLEKQLTRLESGEDVRKMLRDRDRHRHRVVEIYIVEAVQSHALPLVPYKEHNKGDSTTVDEPATGEAQVFKGCYVSIIEEQNEGYPEVVWTDRFFHENIEEWNECDMLLNNLC
ncbi:hypothetical protein Adt_31568 [Abeliophyllum distichum]|uniref:Uncharacterized protein n=1 Tax=Abeliophyllum distichum TaxID=126358 RepID=A0ABD1REG2_9LAMI